MDKLKLTPRDFEILDFLFQHKIATKDQLRNKFFPNTCRQRVGTRLNKLFKSKLIDKTMLYGEGSAFQAYSIKTEGLKILNGTYGNSLSSGKLKSDSPFHDVSLVDIRLLFDRFESCTEYFTENSIAGDKRLTNRHELYPFRKVRSDSVACLNLNGRSYIAGVELEISLKSESRYTTKVKEFYENSLPGVLYFCGNKKIAKVLGKIDKSIAEELNTPPLLSFTSLKNISSQPNKLIFVDYLGEAIIVE